MDLKIKRVLTEDERHKLLDVLEDAGSLEEAIELLYEFGKDNPDIDIKDLHAEILSIYKD